MYNFMDKLISISLPRVRDFRGVSPKAFDGRGNYTMGIKEQLIFSEIDYDDVYIRLILDYRKEPEDAERLSELFKSIINFIHDHYDLKIDNAITFWNWKEYIPSSFNIQEEHYSVDASHWYEWILGPFLFNKLKEK